MKKIVNIVLIVVIIISVGFNIFLFMQIKGINESIVSIRKEKTELEAIVTEKETAIAERDDKIVELEQTILDLTAEVEVLKEQISSIESEKAEINEELETAKKELEEVEQSASEPSKGTEQSSTVGGTGHTEEPAANPEYVPSDEPNQMDPAEAFGKFGATFGGSGLGGSTGADLGNGGYGITLQ